MNEDQLQKNAQRHHSLLRPALWTTPHFSTYACQKFIPTPGVIEQETRSKARELSSEAFLAEILSRKVVQNSDWYEGFGNDIEARLKGLKKRYHASPLRDTDLVLVSMTTASAKESKKILDDILTSFQQKIEGLTKTGLRDDLKSLREVSKTIAQDIGTKKTQLAQIRLTVNVPGWETGISPITQELSLLNQERVFLQSELQKIESQVATIKKESQQNGYSSAVLSAVANDPSVLQFKNRIAAYQEEREGYLEKFGLEHDLVGQIDARIRVIEKQIGQKQAELRDQYQASQLASLEQSYLETTETLTQIEGQFLDASKRQTDLDQKRQDALVLTTDIEELNFRRDRVESTIISTAASAANPVLAEVRSFGSVPIMVSFPKLSVFLPGGIILGLMLSVGLAFLLEFLDDSVKSPIDVVRHLHVPMLGMIPEYDEDDSDQVDLARIAFTQPHGLMGESFRQLKTNLMFSAPSEDLKTLLITSSSAGGGATTSTVNLGITLARDSKRVLLIDANFHRPGLYKSFPADNEQGLSSILVGQMKANEAIRSGKIPGLDVINCGVKPPNPGELLSSAAMQTLLDELKKSYDYILIDAPPSLVVSDTRTLAGLVDGVVLVFYAGETSRGVALRMVRELRSANIRILGILLNAVQARKGGYYRESFESYYDYVGGETETADQTEKTS